VGLSHALAKAAPHQNQNRKKCGKWKKVRDREFFAEQLNNRFLAFITLPNRYVSLFTFQWNPPLDRSPSADGRRCARGVTKPKLTLSQ
jgi:hypothetical protein